MDDNGESLFAVDYLTSSFIRQMLDDVTIFGKKYHPLGWSQSQLKKNSLWLLREKIAPSDITINQILNLLGQFDHIKNPALKAARIGQSFAGSYSYNGSFLKPQIG